MPPLTQGLFSVGGGIVIYAEVEDILSHFNVFAVAQLTDDEENKNVISGILEECITSGSDYTEAVLPTRFLTNRGMAKYVTIQKTIALLYRRYGHEEAANATEKSLNSAIKDFIDSSKESGRTKYVYDVKSHSEQSLFTDSEWRASMSERPY